MTVLVTTVAIPNPILGEWYGKGAKRLYESLNSQPIAKEGRLSVVIHLDAPVGTPDLKEDRMYSAYIAKPFALRQALHQADIAILCDASFYAIRDIQPLIEHIHERGYYLCRNGSTVGEWTSDSCLRYFDLERDEVMGMADVSSYCVGINKHDLRALTMVDMWCRHSNRQTIPGFHTNQPHKNRRSRNPGWVSQERRVKGHRHDQSVLSIVAHQLGMLDWCNRPQFTTYKGSETEETVLVCEGMQ